MALAAAIVLFGLGAAARALVPGAGNQPVSPRTHVIESGRKLLPPGKLVRLGNFPGGGAVTADGRFYWTVSAGYRQNDVRIVSLRKGRPIRLLTIPYGSDEWKRLYRGRAAVEREFGRLKHDYGFAPLRVRGLARVQLHADLVMLARLSLALSRARAVPLAA